MNLQKMEKQIKAKTIDDKISCQEKQIKLLKSPLLSNNIAKKKRTGNFTRRR